MCSYSRHHFFVTLQKEVVVAISTATRWPITTNIAAVLLAVVYHRYRFKVPRRIKKALCKNVITVDLNAATSEVKKELTFHR